MTRIDIAKFHMEKEDSGRPMHPVHIVVCDCGWRTTKRNTSQFGNPNQLDLDLLAHRLDHIEGKV